MKFLSLAKESIEMGLQGFVLTKTNRNFTIRVYSNKRTEQTQTIFESERIIKDE